jgi:hypothetical protein
MSHCRNGKVARLPKPVREQINLQLDAGKTYAKIIAWLTDNGHPGFTPDNISNWRAGGFQDWLKDEKLRDIAIDVAQRHEGSKMEQAARHIGTALIFQTLLKLEPDRLAERLNTKPEQFTAVLNTFNRLSGRANEAFLRPTPRAKKPTNSD